MLRRPIERAEGRTGVVLNTEVAEGPALGYACLPRRLKVTGNSGGVGGKEFVRSTVRPQTYLASARHANVEPNVAVTVNILD
jgi:hypothetical protein